MTIITKSRTVGKEETTLAVGGTYPGLSLNITETDGFGNYQYAGECDVEDCDGDCDDDYVDMDFQTTMHTRVYNHHLLLDVANGYITKGGDRAGDLYDPPDMEEEDRDKDICVQIPIDFLPLVIAELTRIHQRHATPKTQQGG